LCKNEFLTSYRKGRKIFRIKKLVDNKVKEQKDKKKGKFWDFVKDEKNLLLSGEQ